MTLIERRNVPYFALFTTYFTEFVYNVILKQLLDLPYLGFKIYF